MKNNKITYFPEYWIPTLAKTIIRFIKSLFYKKPPTAYGKKYPQGYSPNTQTYAITDPYQRIRQQAISKTNFTPPKPTHSQPKRRTRNKLKAHMQRLQRRFNLLKLKNQ